MLPKTPKLNYLVVIALAVVVVSLDSMMDWSGLNNFITVEKVGLTIVISFFMLTSAKNGMLFII